MSDEQRKPGPDEVEIHEVDTSVGQKKEPTAADLHKIAKLNFGAPDMGHVQQQAEEKEEDKQPA